MPHRNFVAYCETLRSAELRAIGDLSYVQHLAPGRVVFNAGSESKAFYLVTRGIVESINPRVIAGAGVTIFERGDFFGHLETFAGSPHQHTARARDAASVQCFPADTFDDLMRRVPSFFYFLSTYLADELREARLAAPNSTSTSMELNGRLSNFDLVTIYQTIVSSRQTGELQICNDAAEPLAAFWFEDGQPVGGTFQHLRGEEAFVQLFCDEALSGTFRFTRDAQLHSTSNATPIGRTADDLLIHAIRARDELEQLKQRFADRSATLHRKKLNLIWPDDAPQAPRQTAEHVWHVAYSSQVAIGTLCQRLAYCELKVYEAIDALVGTGHFELRSNDAFAKVA